MRFTPTVDGLENRNLLTPVVSEVVNTWTDGVTGHSMAEYTQLSTELVHTAGSGSAFTDNYRILYQHKVVDITADTSVDHIVISEYNWAIDGNGDFTGYNHYKTLDVEYTATQIITHVVTPDGSDPAPPSGDPPPIGPVVPVGPGGGTDPAPPDGNGDPPIGGPTTPIGPDLPALAINTFISVDAESLGGEDPDYGIPFSLDLYDNTDTIDR